jgi:hypothetical protein
MKLKLKFLALGFMLAILLFGGAFLFLLGGETRPVFHDQVLPNGKMVKVTSFHLVWGVDHDPRDRDPSKDSFQLEYVASSPDADHKVRDQECLEVFELIRPISELWGFNHASINAFPSVQRKGRYQIYDFKTGPDGKWTFDRHEAKVFVND